MSHRHSAVAVSALLLGLFVAPARAADFQKYLPDETQVVVSFNVRQLLDSAVVRQHAPALLAHYGLDLLLLASEGNEAGEKALKLNRATLTRLLRDRQEVLKLIDFFKDMTSHMVIAVDPTKPDDPVVFFLGDWKREKVEAFLTMLALFSPTDFKVSLVGKEKLFEGKAGPDETFFAVAPEDGLVMLAPKKKMLREVLTRVAENEKPQLGKEVNLALKQLDLKKTLSAAGMNPLLGASVKLDVMIGRDIEGQMTMRGLEAEAAKEIVDNANQELENLRKQARDRKDLAALAPALNAAKVSAQGRTVSGSIKLTAASIEELVKKLIQLKVTN
jgi:hypothetical protein